jgi:hypothetical protein
MPSRTTVSVVSNRSNAATRIAASSSGPTSQAMRFVSAARNRGVSFWYHAACCLTFATDSFDRSSSSTAPRSAPSPPPVAAPAGAAASLKLASLQAPLRSAAIRAGRPTATAAKAAASPNPQSESESSLRRAPSAVGRTKIETTPANSPSPAAIQIARHSQPLVPAPALPALFWRSGCTRL